MSQESIVIREIRAEDDAQLEQVIKNCFPEFQIPLKGTAYEDAETPKMFESYQGEKEVYYVVVKGDLVLGGAGIKKLKNFDGNVCELQKMYFSPEVRGRGFGKRLIIQCLEAASAFGYDQCYLESASQLEAAIHIYEQAGFESRSEPLGNTGHFSCGIWMLKDL